MFSCCGMKLFAVTFSCFWLSTMVHERVWQRAPLRHIWYEILRTTLPEVRLCPSQVVASLARPLSSPPPSLAPYLRSLFLLIMVKKSSPPLLLLLLHLAYVFVSGQQCHTDSSVLCLSLVLYNEFCLGRDILQFGLYSGAKREWEAWIRWGWKDSMGRWHQSVTIAAGVLVLVKFCVHREIHFQAAKL